MDSSALSAVSTAAVVTDPAPLPDPPTSPPPGTQSLTAKLIKRADNPFLMFQLDATAYPGNSGSPLWHPDSGEVLGVLNSVYIKGAKETALTAPSGLSYAIPVKYVHALLERALAEKK